MQPYSINSRNLLGYLRFADLKISVRRYHEHIEKLIYLFILPINNKTRLNCVILRDVKYINKPYLILSTET